MSEAFCGHKAGYTATGCSGLMAWKLGYEDQMLVILYSIPFDQNIYTNQLGIGVMEIGPTANLFDDLLNSPNSKEYSSKKFGSDMKPIELSRGNFRVKGQMGNCHKPIIQVQVYPRKEHCVADQLKA